MGKHKVTSLLLSYCADVCNIDNEGFTPLHEATNSLDIHIDSVRALIEGGANVNAKAEGKLEITPIEFLATKKTNDPDNILLDEIADLLIQNGVHFYKIPVAAAFGTLNDVVNLINAGADVDEFLAGSELRGLHIAAKFGNMALAKLLIENDAYINATDLDDHTPTEYASSAEIENLLRQHGGKTSDEIHEIICSGMDEMDKAKLGILSGEKLLKAAEIGDLEEVKKIIEQPVETGGLKLWLFIAHRDGKTALHLAAEKGHKPTVEYLLCQGMKLDVNTLNESTPADIIKLILDYEILGRRVTSYFS